MKKFGCCIIMVALILMSMSNAMMAAKACDEGECADLFRTTLNNLLEERGCKEAEIEAGHMPLYDINLIPLGCVYDFSVNEDKGYAIIIWYDSEPEVTEIYFNSETPFKNEEVINIYVSFSVYLYYDDGIYYEASSSIALDKEQLELLRGTEYFRGTDNPESTSENIKYIYKSDNDEYSMTYKIPATGQPAGLINACVPIAGGNLISYFDRFYQNLIPNFTPGMYYPGTDLYLYYSNYQQNQDVIHQLYTDMGTNTSNPGTSVAQFKSGFTKYCNRSGYSVSYSKVFSGSAFSYTLARQRIDAGQPIILFAPSYAVLNIMKSDGFDTLIIYPGAAAHAMAAFGYREITYTLTTGAQRIDKYLRVASGKTICGDGYFNTRLYSIDDAYSITVN